MSQTGNYKSELKPIAKTAEQILEYHTGHAYGLMGLSQINAMKEYAKQVAAQALKDAAENANIRIESPYSFYLQSGPFSDPDGDTISIDKESITKTEIETP